MKTKVFVALLCIVLTTMVFLGEGEAAEKKKVTITFPSWEADPPHEMWKNSINAILQKTHPHITLETVRIPWNEYDTKIMTQMAGGTAPDLVFIWWGKAKMWADMDAVIPLNEFIEKDPDIALDDFMPGVLNNYVIDGNVYGIPTLAFPWILYYNKDLFDEAGIAYPDETWTWEGKFLEAAKKLTQDKNGDGKADIFGFTQNLWFNRCHNIPSHYGGGYYNEDGTKCLMDTPESIQALSFLYDLLHKYKVMPTPDQMLGQGFNVFFSSGRSAMFKSGYFYFESVKNDTKANWGIAPLPAGPNRRPQFHDGEAVGILKGGKNIEEAWEVAKLFAHPDVIKASMDLEYALGARKAVLDPGSDLNDYFFKATSLSKEDAQFLLDSLAEQTYMAKVPNGLEIIRVQAEKIWQPMWLPDQDVEALAKEVTIAIDKVIQGQ